VVQAPKPFVVHFRAEVHQDLRDRLQRTRWPDSFSTGTWEDGADRGFLQELVAYWRDGYDWSQHEAAINEYAHFQVCLDEVPIHFIHERGRGPKPIPLLLNHGWPWTFWDFRKVIRPLTDPAAFGGDARDAFDVIIPSLPGYGFSTPLPHGGVEFTKTADMWATLMTDVLGHFRFGIQGGDWGAMVCAQLGHKYAERIIGFHTHMLAPLDAIGGHFPDRSEYAADEQAWWQQNQLFLQQESGYWAMQATKPQTLAYALEDSPVGLCAWLVEKRRSWSDCGGDVERCFTKDDLLTSVMLYWATRSFNTSARYYYEAARRPWQPSHSRSPVVEAPTGVAVFPRENLKMPRKWAERYYNLQRWTSMPSGGHFAPMEAPDALVGEIRAFFRPLRRAGI
jgi:pimeloyl-ACP methyl ester carboxylesterase